MDITWTIITLIASMCVAQIFILLYSNSRWKRSILMAFWLLAFFYFQWRMTRTALGTTLYWQPALMATTLVAAWPIAELFNEHRRRRRIRNAMCVECGRSLKGLTHHCCPECGTENDIFK